MSALMPMECSPAEADAALYAVILLLWAEGLTSAEIAARLRIAESEIERVRLAGREGRL